MRVFKRTGSKIILLAFLLLFFSLVLAGCGGEGEDTVGQPVSFTLAHSTWVGYGPLYIAQEEGFFEKYGLNPQLTIIEDESQYAGALASGQIEGLANVLDREVIHYAKGTPETVIFAMDESSGGDGIIASAEIKSVEDLKGKTVGLDKSSTSYFFFLTILDEYGVEEEEINIQEMGAGDAGAAFVAGKLDAAVTWEPWLSNASQREGGHVLVTSKDFPHVIVDVVTLRQDFITANPQVPLALTKAWFDAVEWYKAHPQEGNEIMAAALGLETEEIAEMAKGVTFLGMEENLTFFDKEEESNIFSVAQKAVDFWTEKGIISEEVDVNELIDASFVKEAAGQ